MVFFKMKTGISSLRLSALFLALLSVFSAHAQSESSGTLKEVVVTASRFKESANTLPYGVSVITAQDIELSGVSSVNQALMKLLGIPGTVDFYGGGNYALDLRGYGSTASNNQVYVLDGVKINEADSGGTRLSGIGIETIERIEVIHGSAAVMYGAGATGGVILITTKAAREKQRNNAAALSLGAGSFGLLDLRSSANFSIENFSIDVSGNSRKSDNHRDYFKSNQEGQAFTGQWKNSFLKAGIRYFKDTSKSGLPGSLSAVQFNTNPAQSDLGNAKKTGEFSNENTIYFVETDVGPWQFGIDTGDRMKQLDSKDDGVATYQYRISAKNSNFRAKNVSQISNNSNTFIFGYEQTEWTRKTLGQFGSTARQSSEGYYLQDDFKFPFDLILSAGVRTDTTKLVDTSSGTNSKQSQDALDFGFSQRLNQNWVSFGRLGTSFRLPHVDDVGFTLPNTSLKPQSSKDFEAGLRWSDSLNNAELRIYRNNLQNEIAYDATVINANSWNGFGANVNLDPTMRQGIEFRGKFSANENLSLLVNTGFREAKFSEGVHAGNNIPLAANATAAVATEWDIGRGQSLTMGINWVSSKSVDIDNKCSVPAIATLSTGYRFENKNISFAFGIENLSDLKYYTVAYTCTAGVTNGIYPEAGRTFTATGKIVF